jgi:hypothetical protein
MSTGSITTAVDPEIMRDLVELSLIEEYGWTPQYISTLPYKWIQKHNYMKRVKNAAIDARRQAQKFKAEAHSLKPGQKMVREI